jgi:hypothetical protein
VVKWVKEVKRDSWASFKTRKSIAHAKQLLASPAACVAARAAAARRGGAGRGPARGGEWWARARALEGTWRGEQRHGGSWGSGKWPAKVAVGCREKQRERERLEVDDEDYSAIFQKCRDSTIKTKQLSNHISNENMPKSKSVELNKIYNFALRFSFKRVKDLNLF